MSNTKIKNPTKAQLKEQLATANQLIAELVERESAMEKILNVDIIHVANGDFYEIQNSDNTSIEIYPSDWRRNLSLLFALASENEDFSYYKLNSIVFQIELLFDLLEKEVHRKASLAA